MAIIPSYMLYPWQCSVCGFATQVVAQPSVLSYCPRCKEVKASLWRGLWIAAIDNMPAMAICTVKTKDEHLIAMGLGQWTYRRGVTTALRMCLGYAVYNVNGRNNAQACHRSAVGRGSKPRGEARQRMLRLLAGPNGTIIARARLIQIGQARRFKHWPGME